MKLLDRIRLVGRKHCGAKTRAGTPCKRAPSLGDDGLPLNGRCKLHGGHSTGPKTAAGIEQSRRNLMTARAIVSAQTPEARAIRRRRSRKAYATRNGRHAWMVEPLK